MKETTNIRKYFTKIFNKDNSVPYAWFNTQYKELTEKGINELKEYVNKDFVREIIVVSGIEVARPQRTMGDMPEWFRPVTIIHYFSDIYHSNSFVFIIYNSEWGKNIEEEEIKESIKSFPKQAKIIRIKEEE